MSEFKPLQIKRFKKTARKPIKTKPPEIPQDFIRNRQAVAGQILQRLETITTSFTRLTPDQKKAIFLKVDHDRGMNFSGTDLKPIFESGENFTIVKVKDPQLPNLKSKIAAFGSSRVDPKGHAKNETLAYNFKEVTVDPSPFVKVSSDLEERLNGLQDNEHLYFEFELVSDRTGKIKQRVHLTELKTEIAQKYPGIEIVEYEEYHASYRVLARTIKSTAIALINDKSYLGAIAWFDICPTPQQNLSEVIQEFQFAQLEAIPQPATEAPIICIIDSGVNASNPFVQQLIREDLPPKSYISTIPSPGDDANHGTGVAALAAYHSIKIQPGDKNLPSCWIASARVLNAANRLEEEKLFSKTLRKIVSDYKAKGVRIFNMSIAFQNRVWKSYEQSGKINKTSWIARTIDNICKEEDVLFVLCTGNVAPIDISNYIGSAADYPAYFRNRDFALQDPAISTYAITVGSISSKSPIAGGANIVALSPSLHPSSFTRHGPGVLRDIKPDVVEIGGCYAYDTSLSRVVRNPNLNVVTAQNQITPAIHQTVGTSLSAPRVAHKAATILTEMKKNGIVDSSINLLKAFMINATEKVVIDPAMATVLRTNGVNEESLVGYGQINSSTAIYNDNTNVQMFFDGEVDLNEILLLLIPIPEELSQLRGKKKLKITVVYSPEIQKSGLKQYHGSRMKWDLFKGEESDEEIIRVLSTEIDEDEEDVPKALKGYAYGKRKRSKSTIQHDEYTWETHRKEFSTHDYKLALSSQKLWGGKKGKVPVSVVISFSAENLNGVEIDLHSLIRTKIQTHITASQR